LSAALLPIDELKSAIGKVRNAVQSANDRKHVAQLLREAFARIANRTSVELVYRMKT
jgi:hypothetical protein